MESSLGLDQISLRSQMESENLVKHVKPELNLQDVKTRDHILLLQCVARRCLGEYLLKVERINQWV